MISKEKLKKCIRAFFLFPLILGVVGYLISGEQITNSLYASFALYFTNPVSDAYNLWIEVARWTAPLATATAILSVFESLWRRVSWRIACLWGDSVAVYTDTDIHIAFNRGTTAIYPGRIVKPYARSQIIMLESDTASLKFYEENKEQLGRDVHIGLREIVYPLIKEDKQVTFFDINGAISRSLWKELAIWKKGRNSLSITIYGDGSLAWNLLNYGLLLNLYSLEQTLTYNIVSHDMLHKKRFPDFSTANQDVLVYYSADEDGTLDIVRKTDVLIIAEELPAESFQTLCVNCTAGVIYYYSPKAGAVGDYISLRGLKPFGRETDIFTDENIRQERILEKAKQLNAQYASLYGGKAEWEELSGFLKWSNISSADYSEVLGELIKEKSGEDQESYDETLAELEHIRWCRFHYLNYWKAGIPENGKSKDEEKKIHSCLRPYRELKKEERDKDLATIRSLREWQQERK